MKCPSCGSEDIKVVDSRPVDENNSIRRRRECLTCHNRFTTYEVIDAFQPVVVKKDGTKELFDKNKLLSGLLRACQKRPVNAESLANEIEAKIKAALANSDADVIEEDLDEDDLDIRMLDLDLDEN
jgi:transcriptional repressor NrdR